MKTFWKIALVAALVALGAIFLFRPDHRERDAVEQTRRELRQQGFKTDLAEFNFSTTPELRARAAAVTNTDPVISRAQTPAETMHFAVLQRGPDLLSQIGSNAALVVWREEKLPPSAPMIWTRFQDDADSSDDVWPVLREAAEERRAALDAACAAILSGPIRFELNASQGRAMLLRHLAPLRNLSQVLGTRLVLNLHDQKPDAAWTNLLAATRLVTAWETEPAEVSQLARFALAAIACNTTWQALQFDGWSEAQLATLQREWESVDYFKGLPETQAFARACDTDVCRREREQTANFNMPFSYLLRHPGMGLEAFKAYLQRVRYHQHGSYEDEKALMLYHRDREVELRQSVQASTWEQMRGLPGVTNATPFQTPHRSSVQALLNLSQISTRFQGQGQGFLGRAAEAEARRRLIITALALERYRRRHGAYPHTLAELAPEFLKSGPTDFMDGQPLRYYLTDNQQFVLYSVGLDCVDDHGKMDGPHSRRSVNSMGTYLGIRPGVVQQNDLVWPRAATPAEARAHTEEERKNQSDQQRQFRLARAAQEEQQEQDRRATVQNLLAIKPARGTEPTFQGRLLSKQLRNQKVPGKDDATIDDLLTVRQIITGREPDIATFEVPVSYTAVTNIGELELLVDEDTADLSRSDGGEMRGCTQSTNGNCILVWNTGMDPPGAHAIQAQFSYTDGIKRSRRHVEIKGPPVAYYSSNLCQFVAERCDLNPKGAVLYAKLPESNGVYTVELLSSKGSHLKTISGTTSNGVIEIRWDLTDERGQTYTNDSIDSVFRVTLPDSGRSMTQRGP